MDSLKVMDVPRPVTERDKRASTCKRVSGKVRGRKPPWMVC